ncbi:hypothetical protein G9P44_002140 [Scheffersomyces stipitis]|nr:hypothetical protein G9P44_002140 [Scheffersomyces stipitis]
MSSNDDFSICDDCLGPDKHLKMIKQNMGEECKSCTRPFTVLRWNNSVSVNKSKKTIICYTCARAKNCCQSCMLDVNYRIPIDIRDTALKMAGLENPAQLLGASSSTTNREVKAIIADKQDQIFKQKDELDSGDVDRRNEAREILMKLSQRLNDNSKLTKTKSLKSDKAEEEKLNKTDVSKIVAKLPFGGSLDVEKHPEVASFFLFGISSDLPQYAISEFFGSFGKIKTIQIVHRAKCGYVALSSRKTAEEAAKSIVSNGLNENRATAGLVILLEKYPMRVCWGKPKSLGVTNDEHYKISLVVNKVMRQLAEKDTAFSTKDNKTISSAKTEKNTTATNKNRKIKEKKTRGEKSAPSSAPQNTSYKSMRDDFEL